MTTKSLWQWDKHNVLKFIEKNYYKNVLNENFIFVNEEFTSESLIIKASKHYSGYRFYYGYSERIISENLLELLKDGILDVRYISVKVNLEKNYWKENTSSGSKTVAVYRLK